MDGGKHQTVSIPVYRPDLSGNEARYVADCIESTWISSKGSYIAQFESQFARRVGVAEATAVCNGTVALHLAMLALGVGAGDEVIVPTLTYVASVNAVTYAGAVPVFVDSLPDTWQIDPADVRRRLTPRTKAIMAVHVYGHACDMDALRAIAREHRLFLIEDCAEAIGSLYKGRHVGSLGDISTFSFFGNKTMTTGEGGMVVSNDPTLMERSRHFKGQGLAEHREYWHDVVGYNYRMTNICAALGVAQMERLDTFLLRKRALADAYCNGLAGLPVRVHGEHPDVHHSYWMVSILVDDAADREPLRQWLAAQGIETRPVFFPVHTMPIYSGRFQRHPVAEDLARRGINLPSWPAMRDHEIEHVIGAIGGYFRRRRAAMPSAAHASTEA
jgi:perosamine synthetase